MCRFPSFLIYQHTHKKASCCMKSFWTKWWNQISHHLTSLSFFILGPASFNETTSHPSSKTKDHKEHQAPLKQEYHTKPVQLLNMPDFFWTWSISFSTGSAGLPHTSPFGALFVHDRTRQLDAQFPAWVRKMYSEFVELDKNAKPFILKWICLVWQPWNWNSKTKERKLTRVVVCQHRRSQIREPKMLVGNSMK